MTHLYTSPAFLSSGLFKNIVMKTEDNFSRQDTLIAQSIEWVAIDFIEWVHKSNDWVFERGRWRRWDDDKYITTQQLFNYYKQSK